MNSFYGGQSGRTYHIAKRYKNIQEMKEAFAQGGSYVQVNYGEYVLISTLNKNSDENGLLFRRGFDYDDEVSLSEMPNREEIEMDNQNPSQPVINSETGQAKKKYYNNIYDQENNNQFVGIRFDEDRYQADLDTYFSHVGNGAIYVGRIVGADGKAPAIGLLKWEDAQGRQDSYSTLESDSDADGYEGLIEGQPVYNNAIQAKTFSILDHDGNISEVKLALKIPKPTFIVSAQSVDAYGITARTHTDEASTIEDQYTIDQNEIEYNANLKIRVIHEDNDNDKPIIGYSNLIREHSQTGKEAGHPFYHNYDIAIPKGIKGDTVENIQVKKAVLQNESDPPVNADPWFRPNQGDTDTYGKTIKSGDEYITFDIRNYDCKQIGDVIPNQGRLPFTVIKEIVSLPNQNRLYNPASGNPPQIGDIYQISEQNHYYAICTKAGTFDINAFENNPTIIEPETEGPAWWRCVIMEHDPSAELLEIDYKAGKDPTFISTGFLDYMFLDYDGTLYAKYTNGEKAAIGFIDSINNIEYDDGRFTITYKQNRIESLFINTIVDVQRVGDQLYLLYSDDTFRQRYYSQNPNDCRAFSYSGLNSQSRFALNSYGDIQIEGEPYFYYIRLNSSLEGGYHIQGEFNFEDIIWITSGQNPEYNIYYIGKLADIDGFLNQLIAQDVEIEEGQSKHFDGPSEYNRSLTPETGLYNIYKEGYVINITHKIDNENIIDFYIYNFNYNNSITTINNDIVLEYFESRIDELDNKISLTEEEIEERNRLSALTTFIEENEDISIYTNWYSLQAVNEVSISPERAFLISPPKEEDEDQPESYGTSDFKLNQNGIWFVVSYGHDQES